MIYVITAIKLIITGIFFSGLGYGLTMKDSPKFCVKDGKIYTHPSNGAYLFISNKQKPIEGDLLMISPPGSKPLKLNNHGHATIDVNNGSNKHQLKVFVDSKPPVIDLYLRGAERYSRGDKLVFGKNLKILFSGVDKHSGIDQVYFSFDDQQFQKYISFIPLAEEKEYFIKYTSQDKVGNTSAIRHKKFLVDTTPPQSKHRISNFVERVKVTVLSDYSRIRLSASDDVVPVRKINYSIVGSNNKELVSTFKSKPIKLDSLKQGEYNFRYYSVDAVGNSEAQNSFNFYLDKTPPVANLDYKGDIYRKSGKIFVSPRTKISLNTKDNKAGIGSVEYSIQGGPFKKYSEGFSNINVSGPFEVAVRVKDNVRNQKIYRYNNLYMDRKLPAISHKLVGKVYKLINLNYISKGTKVALSSGDSESGLSQIFYQTSKNGEAQLYNGPFKLEKSGVVQLQYYSKDKVSNITKKKQLMLFLDEKPPEIFYRFSNQKITQRQHQGKTLPVYSVKTSIFISATDGESGVKEISYNMNGKKMVILKDAWINLNKKGLHVFHIKSKDRVGNSNKKSVRFFIDYPTVAH